jgi:hypothetical protein
MQNQPVVIHTDRLGIAEISAIVRYALTRPIERVRYRTATPIGLCLTQVLRFFKPRLTVECCSWDLSRPHPSGSTVYHHLQRVSLAAANTIATSIEHTGSFIDHLPFAIAENRRHSFLRTQIVGDIYWPVFQGLFAVSEGYGAHHLVLTPVGALAHALDTATRAELPNVHFIGVPQLRDGFLIRTAWFFAIHAQRLVARLKAGRPPLHLSGVGRVGIAHNWGIQGEAAPRDVWWYQASGLAPERCTIIFGRTKLSSSAADASVRWLQSHGFDTAATPESPLPELNVRQVDGLPSLVRILRDAACYPMALRLAMRAPAGSWQASMYLRALTHVRTWQTLFARQNIKVWFDASDSSMDLAALACDSVGAIKLGLFWSSEVLPTSRTSAAHAVRFIPGPAAYRAYQHSPGGADLVVEVGSNYQSRGAIEASRAAGMELRTSLESRRVAYVIAAFDRSSGPHSLLPSSATTGFYQALLAYAEQDESVRLVFKPKNPLRETLGIDAKVMRRIEALIAAARVNVLDSEDSVMDAAFAADIVVGLGVSSAGFLTAVAGIRTIFSDPSLAADSDYTDLLESAGWTRGINVFDQTSEVVAAIAQHRKSGCDTSLGSLQHFTHQIDPFGDGDSAQRVGRFIHDFFRAIDTGSETPEAVELAAESYATIHGVNRVHRPTTSPSKGL